MAGFVELNFGARRGGDFALLQEEQNNPYQNRSSLSGEQEARQNAFSILNSRVISFTSGTVPTFTIMSAKGGDLTSTLKAGILDSLEAAKGFPSVQQEICDFVTNAFYSQNLASQDKKRQSRDRLALKSALNSVIYELTKPESKNRFGFCNTGESETQIIFHNEPTYAYSGRNNWALNSDGTWQTADSIIAEQTGEVEAEKQSGYRKIDLSKPPLEKLNPHVDDTTLKEEEKEPSQKGASFAPFEEILSNAKNLASASFSQKDADLAFKDSYNILCSFFDFDNNGDFLGIKREYAKEDAQERCKSILLYSFEATESSPEARKKILELFRWMENRTLSAKDRGLDFSYYDEINFGLQHVAAEGIYSYAKHCALVTYHELAKKGYAPQTRANLESMFNGISSTGPLTSEAYINQSLGQFAILVDLLGNGSSLGKYPEAMERTINGLSAILWSKFKNDDVLAAGSMANLNYNTLAEKEAAAKSLLDRAWDEKHHQPGRAACIFYLEKGVFLGTFDEQKSKDLAALHLVASSEFDLIVNMLIVSSGQSRLMHGVDSISETPDYEIFENYSGFLANYFKTTNDTLPAFKEPAKFSDGTFMYPTVKDGVETGFSRFDYAKDVFTNLLKFADKDLENGIKSCWGACVSAKNSNMGK